MKRNIATTSQIMFDASRATFRKRERDKKIIRMYLKDCFTNIVNGYPAILPGNMKIMAELHRIKDGEKRHISRVRMVRDGEKVMAVNPKFPNHKLQINLSGLRADILGVEFKAGPNLKRTCSKKCFNGFKYHMYE